MSEVKNHSQMIYLRLGLAYFLQFAIWGSWSVVLGGFGEHIGLKGIGILYTAIPLATVAALFINPLVDRFFSAQYVLSFLHLISAACLILCGVLCRSVGDPAVLFYPLFALMLLYGIVYMPSITLMNSIVFKNIPNPANAPYVFVFGTFGWIVVNLVIDIFGGGQATPNFFFIGGACAVLLAIFALSLPKTLPNKTQSGEKSQGAFGALVLFKNPSFAIFAICATCASFAACGYYFPMLVPMLSQKGYPSPVSLGTLNQFSELLFMVALPFCAVRFGLKNCLFLGMAAWCARYVFFMQDAFAFALLGLLVHGFCYSFLYAAAYTYADKMAPDHLKTSVQGLVGFLLLGVGQVGGSLYYERQLNQDEFRIPAGSMKVAASETPVPLPPWSDPNLDDSAWRYLNLSQTIGGLFKQGEAVAVHHLGVDVDKDKNGTITWDELQAIGEEGLEYRGISYTKADLEGVFAQVARLGSDSAAPQDAEISVTLAQWQKAQSRPWAAMLVYPSVCAGVFALLFLILGKNPETAPRKEEKAGSDTEAR